MQPRPSSHAAGKARRPYAPRMAPTERRTQLIDAALSAVLAHGYEGVTIEAIARAAGVTRPVIYDHFENRGAVLKTLIDREERYALAQLEQVVPDRPGGDRDPTELMAAGVRRFLDAVASRPATWRIILLPLEGTPAIVRQNVETNRARASADRNTRPVGIGTIRADRHPLDVDLPPRAIRSFGEEAGRMVLTDPQRYSPQRYEHFVESMIGRLWPRPL